jgi:hypothetical protein
MWCDSSGSSDRGLFYVLPPLSKLTSNTTNKLKYFDRSGLKILEQFKKFLRFCNNINFYVENEIFTDVHIRIENLKFWPEIILDFKK